MPSVTEVINDALDDVNVSPILNADDADAKTKRAKRIYEMSRGVLLEKEHWRFAVDRISIAADAAAPLNGWTYQYTLPVTCRKPIRLNDDDTIEWVQEGRKIMTDTAAPIILEFIKEVTDPNVWDASFLEAMRSYLAMRYAKAFQQDNDKAAREFQEHKDNWNEAVAKNGQVGTPPRPAITALTTDIRKF